MTAAEEHERMAALVQRLAVLTAAGLPPLSAWRYAVEGEGEGEGESGGEDLGRAAVAGLTRADELPGRLADIAQASAPGAAWRVLAAVWIAATEAGASLAPVLHRTAEVLRDVARSAREVDVALAGPAATSRIVLALPAFALLLGWLLGFDLVAGFSTSAGPVCAAAGLMLVVVAWRWNRRLLRWARTEDVAAGLDRELVTVGVAAGSPPERAVRAAAEACRRAGLPPPGEEVDALLAFSTRAGVPVAALLRAEADECRRAARAEAARRAAVLESRLLLPLGVCVLPAFVLLGVVPIALAIMSSTDPLG